MPRVFSTALVVRGSSLPAPRVDLALLRRAQQERIGQVAAADLLQQLGARGDRLRLERGRRRIGIHLGGHEAGEQLVLGDRVRGEQRAVVIERDVDARPSSGDPRCRSASCEPPVPVGTSATVSVSVGFFGVNHSTDGLRIVVDAALRDDRARRAGARAPRGRASSTPNRFACSAARAAPLPAATGSIAIRTSRVSITSPPVPNTVPISNERGSKPRSFQRASAAVMPVASSGPSVSTTVQSCDHAPAWRSRR